MLIKHEASYCHPKYCAPGHSKTAAKLFTKDEVRRIAANTANPPELVQRSGYKFASDPVACRVKPLRSIK